TSFFGRWVGKKLQQMNNAEALTFMGLIKGASNDEVSAAYKKLAQSMHPDKGGDISVFQNLQQARKILLPKICSTCNNRRLITIRKGASVWPDSPCPECT
ncbi:hypothetical protein DRQ50_13875, partial [bacterium]